MPEITVTESQQETLEEVRSELAAEYVDTYGHVRTTDVVQYLLDTYTPPGEGADDAAYERLATAEFPLLQQVATDVEGVPGSGIDAETMRGELLSTLGAAEFAARLAELDGDDSDADDAATEDATEGADGTTDESSADEGEAASAESTDDSGGHGGTADDSDEAADESGPEPAGGPGAVLSAANKLLTDHDDKWRKGGGEEPYEVDLPDGTTEAVRTKDDVKQLLFKNY